MQETHFVKIVQMNCPFGYPVRFFLHPFYRNYRSQGSVNKQLSQADLLFLLLQKRMHLAAHPTEHRIVALAHRRRVVAAWEPGTRWRMHASGWGSTSRQPAMRKSVTRCSSFRSDRMLRFLADCYCSIALLTAWLRK